MCGLHFQIAAISEQASESTGDPSSEKSSSPLGWKIFDMHAVVDATEDLLLFIFSDKGSRVRLFLLWDIIEAADIFMEDEIIDCMSNEKSQGQRMLLFEVILKFISLNKYLNWGFYISSNSCFHCQNDFGTHFMKPSDMSFNVLS